MRAVRFGKAGAHRTIAMLGPIRACRRADRSPGPDRRLTTAVLRLAAACGVLVAVYVAAQLAGARHAGWVAAGLGLPLAAASACALRPHAPHAAPPVAAAERSLLWPAAGALFALVLLPVLLTQLPPEDDYPNHLARIQVMAEGGRDALLAQFYAIRWRLIPNLGMELLLPGIAAATSVFFAGKLFLVLTMLLLLSGPLAIHWALFRQPALGPLVAVLFAYNSVSKMGILNYEFGLGLALFATASWIALRARGAATRAAVSACWVMVLFLCHLEALGIYALAIGSFELWRAWPVRRQRTAAAERRGSAGAAVRAGDPAVAARAGHARRLRHAHGMGRAACAHRRHPVPVSRPTITAVTCSRCWRWSRRSAGGAPGLGVAASVRLGGARGDGGGLHDRAEPDFRHLGRGRPAADRGAAAADRGDCGGTSRPRARVRDSLSCWRCWRCSAP